MICIRVHIFFFFSSDYFSSDPSSTVFGGILRNKRWECVWDVHVLHNVFFFHSMWQILSNRYRVIIYHLKAAGYIDKVSSTCQKVLNLKKITRRLLWHRIAYCKREPNLSIYSTDFSLLFPSSHQHTSIPRYQWGLFFRFVCLTKLMCKYAIYLNSMVIDAIN